jgi:hypothetical protein
VTNCLFDGPAIGLASAGLTGGSLVIGGSPTKGNEVSNANFGFLFIDSDNSSVEISHNVVATAKFIAIAVWQRQGQPRSDRDLPYFRLPLIPPKVLISHNNLGADAGGIAIDIANFGPGKRFDLAASHNKITMKDADAGIWNDTDGAVIGQNVIEGTADVGAIMQDAGEGSTLFGNNVENVTATAAPTTLWWVRRTKEKGPPLWAALLGFHLVC